MTRFEFIRSGAEHLAASIDLPTGADDRSVPTVIVVHGLTGSRLGVSYHLVEFARRLAAVGIGCIRFDQSGCGESTGEFTRLTIRRIVDDTRAVRDWAGKQSWCDATRFGYVGMSVGALGVIAVESEQPARAVALWAPVYDMVRVFRQTTKTGLRAFLEHKGWVPYRGLRIGKAFVDQLDAVDTSARLAESTSPLLLLHAKGDDVVSFDESGSYVRRCDEIGRPCELIRFNGADHDFIEYDDRTRLLASTCGFFAERLKCEGGPSAESR
ncbi:MAG: alpha/beta fold hydrolase [Phycisphaeraceae bacterium]